MKRIIGWITCLAIYAVCGQAAMREDCIDNAPSRILIVGGGIAGLALANSLHNYGIPYDLIEKREVEEMGGTGIALPANATWALEQLRLKEELFKKSDLITAMEFRTDQDEVLIREDITQVHCDGAQFLSILRSDLHDLLLSPINGPHIRFGMTFETIEDKGEQGVQVTFRDGSEWTYNLVVGADGIHSQVRQCIFGPSALVSQEVATWRTVVKCPGGLKDPTYMLGGDTAFLLYPLKDDLMYVYCHKAGAPLPEDVEEKRIPTLKELFRTYKGYVPQVLEQMTDPSSIISGTLQSMPSIEWVKGNVALIGDASHACSPMLQQGGALAIEDGWALGDSIHKGLTAKIPMEEILKNFMERRRQRVEFIVTQSDQRIKILPDVRNTIIREKGAPNVTLFRVIMKENP